MRHPRPQAPQLVLSVASVASQPLDGELSQSPKPGTQRCTVQLPDAQPSAAVCGSAQTVPHAPQFDGSMEVFEQYVAGATPQVTRGDAQVVPHTPPEHTRPAVHVTPHAPQFALSVCVLTSQPSMATPLQSRKPALQVVTAHAPAVHVDAAFARTHARPHAPQFALSVCRLASQPDVASRSQSAKFAAQLATAHAPATQDVTAVCARAQFRPHAPQFDGSFWVLAQYAADTPVHAARGAAQVVPQVPPEQTWPAGQLVPQVPQLPLSACVLTSQPLAATPSQSAKPGAQVPMAQALAAQVAVACGRTQARPQAPQLVTLSVVPLSQPFAGSASQSPKPVAQRTTLHEPTVQPVMAVFGSVHP